MKPTALACRFQIGAAPDGGWGTPWGVSANFPRRTTKKNTRWRRETTGSRIGNYGRVQRDWIPEIKIERTKQ